MTRRLIATAAALVAATTLLASGAQACISCEHVPPVVRSSSTLPHTGHYYAAEPYQKKAHSAAAAKKRIAKSVTVDKPAKIAKAAKAEPVTIAKAEPVETKAKVDSESSSISVASTDVAAAAGETTKEAAAKPVDCKKFFPSVGMTLTVPCE
jgi:hypothetical protein